MGPSWTSALSLLPCSNMSSLPPCLSLILQPSSGVPAFSKMTFYSLSCTLSLSSSCLTYYLPLSTSFWPNELRSPRMLLMSYGTSSRISFGCCPPLERLLLPMRKHSGCTATNEGSVSTLFNLCWLDTHGSYSKAHSLPSCQDMHQSKLQCLAQQLSPEERRAMMCCCVYPCARCSSCLVCPLEVSR